MNENEEIIVTTNICSSNNSLDSNYSCSESVLKIPKSEILKFQSMELSKGEAVGIEYYPEFFFASLTITLLFWLIAKFGWLIVETIKRA